MGDLSLDPLLSPDRVAVVGFDDVGVVASGAEMRRFEPERVESHDEWLAGADLAIVTTATDIATTVPILVDVGVGSVLVTTTVETTDWFELLEIALDADTALLGPDATLAVPDPGLRVNLDETVETGAVALVGEDPQTIRSLVAEGVSREIGFSTILATGPQATVRPADALRAFDADDATSVVLARPDRIDHDFFEGAADLSPEMALAVHAPKRACADEPVDTYSMGALAPAEIRDAVLEQAGALRVDSVDRLLDLAPALAEQPLPDGDGVVVVSNAGGPGVMATDAVGASRLSMAELADETVDRLNEVIPERAYARNPLDLLADSDIAVFSDVLDAVLTDPAVDAAVVISAPNPLFTFEAMADIVASARAEHESPVVTALMGGESTSEAASRLRSVGIPNYFDPFQAVAVLSALADQRDAAASRQTASAEPATIPVEAVRSALEERGEPRALLEAAGISVGDGGEGVDVSVVATDHPQLGPIVVVGVEEYASVLNDMALRVVPAGDDEIRSMFDDLRSSQLLKGARGTEAIDVDGLVDAVRRVAAIPGALSQVETVSVTLRATRSGVSTVDAGLVLGDHQ